LNSRKRIRHLSGGRFRQDNPLYPPAEAVSVRYPCRKGQIFAQDLTTAAILYMIALGTIFVTWDISKTRLEETAKTREMERESGIVADILAKTQGNPTDWEKNPQNANITSIGLAVEERVINTEKMAALAQIDPKKLKETLRLGADKAYITLKMSDGKSINVGERPQATEAVRTTRIVSYMGEPALLEVTVWAAE